MKALAAILCVMLAACAAKVPPRAILLPPATISAVDTAPVETATGKVSDGAEKVAEANRKARASNNRASDTTVLLRAAMERARILAEGQEALRGAWEDAERFAAQLGNDLSQTTKALDAAESESSTLREGIKALSLEVSALKSSAAVNKAAGIMLLAENVALREQAQQGNAARDELVALQASSKTTIAAQRKWLWKLGALSAILTLAVLGLAYLLFKP